MNDSKEEIVKIMERVTKAYGYERGMICGRDCLLQWRDGYLTETIEAWNRYVGEFDSKSHTDCNRHGAWVPAIPL
jgi:hypothetical protein